MARDSFVFYRSFLDVAKMLKNKRDQTKMLLAIIELGLEDTISDDLPLEMRMSLTQMQASINGAKNRHDRAVINGKKGGAPKGNKNAAKKKNNQNNLNSNDNVNVNVNENDNDIIINDNVETSSGMAPLEEGQPSDDDKYPWEN